MRIPNFDLLQIRESPVRESFKALQDFLEDELFLTGFKFFTLTFAGAEPHHKFQHLMGFVPQDVIVTSKIGTGVVTFNQDLTDASTMDLSVTGPCTIRFIAGTFG